MKSVTWDDLMASYEQLEKSVRTLVANAEKAAQLIEKQGAILEEIREYAEDQYDGPEDKRMTRILAICGR